MNLIANELVIVQPMSSVTGYVAYVQYTAGSTKGATTRGDVLNSPFKLGNVDSTYTSSKTVDTFDTFTSGTSKVSWTPVVPGTIRALDANGVEVSDNATTPWTVSADGTITQGAYVSSKSATDVKKIAYVYDNVVIPQNDIPTVNAEMKSIPLLAKARRVAVYYSQIASYQAKQDYGFDLGAQLSEKAVGQLSYKLLVA